MGARDLNDRHRAGDLEIDVAGDPMELAELSIEDAEDMWLSVIALTPARMDYSTVAGQLDAGACEQDGGSRRVFRGGDHHGAAVDPLDDEVAGVVHGLGRRKSVVFVDEGPNSLDGTVGVVVNTCDPELLHSRGSSSRFSRVNERREKSAHPLLNGVLEVAE